MTDDILDYEKPNNEISIHAKKSFGQLLISIFFCFLFLIGLVFCMGFFRIFFNWFTSSGLLILMAIAFYYAGSGFKNGLRSIEENEKSFFKKYIGTIGNLIIALIMGGGLLVGFFAIVQALLLK